MSPRVSSQSLRKCNSDTKKRFGCPSRSTQTPHSHPCPAPACEGLLQTRTELLSFSLKTLIKTWKDTLVGAFSTTSVISECQSVHTEPRHLISDCSPLGQTCLLLILCTAWPPVQCPGLWLWIHVWLPSGRDGGARGRQARVTQRLKEQQFRW